MIPNTLTPTLLVLAASALLLPACQEQETLSNSPTAPAVVPDPIAATPAEDADVPDPEAVFESVDDDVSLDDAEGTLDEIRREIERDLEGDG